MKIIENIRKLFRHEDFSAKVVNKIEEKYKENLEDEKVKDAEQSAAREVIEYVRRNPNQAPEILKGILDKKEIPNKIFEQAATDISKIDEIPDTVIPKAVADSEINVPDQIIENIIENGDVNRKEKIELINNIDSEKIKQRQIGEELKELYKICADLTELDLINKLESINIVEKNERLNKLEEAIIAKKMAANYRKFGGTKINTLGRYLPVEKMLEEDLPSKVYNEYEMMKESEKEENKVDKSELKIQILDEIAKNVASTYNEIGEFVIPQSKNMTQITPEEEKKFIGAIQIHSGQKLTDEDIININLQIKGRSNNIHLKDFLIKLRNLPKAQADIFMSNTKELLDSEEELKIFNQLANSGIIQSLQGLPKEQRKEYIYSIKKDLEEKTSEKDDNQER